MAIAQEEGLEKEKDEREVSRIHEIASVIHPLAQKRHRHSITQRCHTLFELPSFVRIFTRYTHTGLVNCEMAAPKRTKNGIARKTAKNPHRSDCPHPLEGR